MQFHSNRGSCDYWTKLYVIAWNIKYQFCSGKYQSWFRENKSREKSEGFEISLTHPDIGFSYQNTCHKNVRHTWSWTSLKEYWEVIKSVYVITCYVARAPFSYKNMIWNFSFQNEIDIILNWASRVSRSIFIFEFGRVLNTTNKYNVRPIWPCVYIRNITRVK